MKTLSKVKKKQQKKKIIITAIAVGAAGILGYFGWQYLKKRKSKTGVPPSNNDLDDLLKDVSTTTAITTADNPSSGSTVRPRKKPTASNTGNQDSAFPLKKGSKGSLVQRLQEALLAKYGKSILPRYGADGDFGSETIAALKKIGFPPPITQSAYNVLVQDTKSATASESSTGQQLFDAANANDFSKVIAVLKQMTTITDYNNANEVFKTQRIGGGVRQTIVTGLLNRFKTKDQKEKLKWEFLRIGLEFDGKQWSVSGLDGFPIMTVIPATVWINGVHAVQVPARTVLGKAINRKLDYTLFQNRGKYFLVQTKCVKHL